jgi:hypothetical protein
LDQLVSFYEIHLGGYAIEGNLNAVIFNFRIFAHSKMVDVRTSEVVATLAPVSMRL